MEAVLFYCSSALAIVSSLLVIFLPRPARALLSLIITMTALTVLYLLLGAYFVAIAQIIVYAGAVLVLFLFVIMLQGTSATDIPLWKRFSPVFIGSCFLAVLLFLSLYGRVIGAFHAAPLQTVAGDVKSIGLSLFSNFMLPFELTSILLLLGVFAAVALAKKEEI